MNENEINQYLIDHKALKEDGKLSSGITNYVNRHDKQLYDDLRRITGIESDNLSQLLYHFVKKVDKIPVCQVCGGPVKFIAYDQGYRTTCSYKCAHIHAPGILKKNFFEKHGVSHPMHLESTKEKIKATNMRLHGVENVFQREDVKEKMKKTSQEKYHTDNPMQSKEVKKKIEKTCMIRYGCKCSLSNKDVIAKRNKTNIERYGNKCCMKNEKVKEKIKATCIRKYGYDWVTKSPEFQKKVGESKSKHFYESLVKSGRLKNVTPMFSIEEYTGVRTYDYKFKCNTCGKEFMSTLYAGHVPICPDCYVKTTGTSKAESEVYDFLCSLIDKNDIIKHDRTTLGNKKELDFYIPKYKLAIEYNGLYVHSELNGKGKDYHLDKTKRCESKGIHLIQIYSNEWLMKSDLVKDYIKSCLGIYDRTIYARNCSCKFIASSIARNFLEENHLQGPCRAKYYVGLFYRDELIGVESFSKPRFSKKEHFDYEIIRFANKNGCHISGGFSKMLSFFRKMYSGSILTYSDRRLFTGNVYRNNGFIECEPTKPGYSYSNNDWNLTDRMDFQKWKLVQRYGDKYNDWSELEIAHDLGYYRIYDCGNWKFYLP